MNPATAQMIMVSGRSWWQARYFDGKVLSEWETSLVLPDSITLASGRSSRWEEVPKTGMVGLRLLCPDRAKRQVLVGELEDLSGTGQFIQLKVGGIQAGGISYCDAHIIGYVKDLEGNCYCRAWETRTQRLVTFEDNVFNMKYKQIGRLNLAVQGIRI